MEGGMEGGREGGSGKHFPCSDVRTWAHITADCGNTWPQFRIELPTGRCLLHGLYVVR